MDARSLACCLLVAPALAGCVASGWSFAPGGSPTDRSFFVQPPVVHCRADACALTWTQGDFPFYFHPRYEARDGRLVFAMGGMASSGNLVGARREHPIEGRENLDALRSGGAFWWESEPRPNGRLVRIEVIRDEGARFAGIGGTSSSPPAAPAPTTPATPSASTASPAPAASLGPSPSRAEKAADVAKRLANIAPGEERDVGGSVRLRMVRIQASEPIHGGWHLATSSDGAFSVEMPIRFNEFVTRATAEDGVEIRLFNLGAKTPGALAWTVICAARPDRKRVKKPSPDGVTSASAPHPSMTKRVSFDDMDCALIVEAQGDDPMPPERDVERFFGSFRRTGKLVW